MEKQSIPDAILNKRKLPTRLSTQQTIDLVKSIPALNSLFKPKPSRNEPVDDSEGILYLSRFTKDIEEEASVVPKLYKAKSSSSSSVVDEVEEEVQTSRKIDEIQKEKSSAMPSQGKKEKRRLAMSLSTLAAKPEARAKLVRDGAIPLLLTMAALPDRSIQRSCASVFASLSKEKSLRNRMIEDGAMGSIITLLSNPNNSVVYDCCKALCNLCADDGAELRAMKDGLPFAMMHAVSTFPNCVDVCLKTFLNLSCVPDRYQRIEEVADALMHFSAYALSIENEILVASAMCNLSALKSFQLRLVEDGCLRFVERIIKSTNKKLRVLAAKIIDNLTTDSRSRVKMVDNGIIPMLMITSRDESEDVKTSSVKAFYNLARDMICREKIVHFNAVTVILKLSTDTFENVLLGKTASKILRILCGDSRIANKLIKDGIIKALMNLLRTDDEVIQQYCAESICSMFQIEEVMGRLIDQGAVGILVGLSETTINPITSEWCSFALYHLAVYADCPLTIISQAVLPCVIKLSNLACEHTKYFCAAALDHMCSIKAINCSSSIQVLVNMLEDLSDVGIHGATKTFCAAALYNLTDKDENCFLMLDVGALQPVVRLTGLGRTSTKKNCAAILSRLSLHSDYYSHFGRGDVLKVLLELSSIDDVYTQRKVIIALSNLSQSKELRDKLLELNPIPYIMSLASKCDENVRRGCACIVCNLSYEIGSEKPIADAGIVSTLLITAMITSDQLATKIICVKAFVNLMADVSLFKLMVHEGLIWGLSSLAQLESQEMRTLCLKALSKLSHDYAKEMLSSTPCVRTITKAVDQTDDVELMRFGARTLTNILVKSTDEDVDFRRLAVASMVHLASSSDLEIQEICILCLCVTSQSEKCREDIVAKGMLWKFEGETIFQNKRVCFAYITMFENIAHSASLRHQIVDNKCIDRFTQITALLDMKLNLAICQALYCLSCASKNIPVLMSQGVLHLIHLILDALEYEEPELDLCRLLTFTLYNLTTCEETHALAVQRGIIRAFTRIWPVSKDDFKLCALTITAVTHLSCGSINSSLLVREGGAEILCFSVSCKDDEYPCCNYVFDIILLERVTASMRNLFGVVSNHERMIKCGCLKVLITLASESNVLIRDLESGLWSQSLINRKKAVQHHSSIRTLQNHLRAGPEHYTIRKNCSSSLRSVTHNPMYREVLVESGALAVILEGETIDMAIPQVLMSDLEQESWQNGSRGPQKEARVSRKPCSIDTSLLGSTRLLNTDEVQLHTTPPLEKFHVWVDVEEPYLIRTHRSRDPLIVGIDQLATYTDIDELDTAKAMMCPKQECIDEDFLAIAKIEEAEQAIEDAHWNEFNSTPNSPDPHHVGHEPIRRDSNSIRSHSSMADDESLDPSVQLHSELMGTKVPLPAAAASPVIGNRRSSLPKIAANRPSSSLTTRPAMQMSQLTVRPTTSKGFRRENPDKAMKNIMSLIKISKVTKGERIEKVIEEWKSISRF